MLYSIFCSVLLAFFLVSPVFPSNAGSAQEKEKSPSTEDGKLIVETKCQGCHGLDLITKSNHTLDEWRAIVDQMISNGASVEDDELESVVQYLARNFGPAKPSKKNEERKKNEEKKKNE
jgi:mono/diheme cytochrome c family protein